MKHSVAVKFERRPDERGIVWSHDPSARSYPGKLLPGYIIMAKYCGIKVYLEVQDVAYEKNIMAKIVEVEPCHESYSIMRLYDGESVLSLSRENIFSCESPGRKLSKKEKSATVLLQTQQIDFFEAN